MLNYHNVGTVYMKGYIPSKIRNSVVQSVLSQTPMSLPNQPSAEINSKTYNAFPSQKSGFTEELNRRNGTAVADSVPFDEEDLVVSTHVFSVTVNTWISASSFHILYLKNFRAKTRILTHQAKQNSVI